MQRVGVMLMTALLVFSLGQQVNGECAENKFLDVPEGTWYYEDIQSAVRQGYIEGVDDEYFLPNKEITNAELYAMLARKYNLEVKDRVEGEHWAKSYMDAVSHYDWKNITLSTITEKTKIKEAIRLMLLLNDVNNLVTYDCFEDTNIKIENADTIFKYNSYSDYANRKGILKGNGIDKIDIEKGLTRAEAVSYIERIDKLENLDIVLPDYMDGIELNLVGDAAPYYVSEICEVIEKFPDNIKEKIKEDGLKITVTDKDQRDYGIVAAFEASGVYYEDKQEIVLFNGGKRPSLFYGIYGTLMHELGHYIHLSIMDSSDKGEIRRIFNQEKSELEGLSKLAYKDYCKTNQNEYCAELVKFYMTHLRDIEDYRKDIPMGITVIEKYLK